MKTPIEIKPSPCPSQAPRRLACKISPPYVAPLSSSSRAHVMAQVAYLVDLLLWLRFLAKRAYIIWHLLHSKIVPLILHYTFTRHSG